MSRIMRWAFLLAVRWNESENCRRHSANYSSSKCPTGGQKSFSRRELSQIMLQKGIAMINRQSHFSKLSFNLTIVFPTKFAYLDLLFIKGLACIVKSVSHLEISDILLKGNVDDFNGSKVKPGMLDASLYTDHKGDILWWYVRHEWHETIFIHWDDIW